MANRYKLLLFVLSMLSLMSGLLLWQFSLAEAKTEVIFLNVGQGDAILISQGKNQILIDGGRSGKELLGRIGRHIPFWDRNIEVVIATHPDADHIGGLPALLRAYRVNQVLTTGAGSTTETSQLFEEATKRATGSGPTTIFRGATITLPKGGMLSIEYPLAPIPHDTVIDTNEGSIVARFVYGETSFLLTGDLPREELALAGEVSVTVLKVAHHGSKYSTSQAFLDLIRPKEAVISVGKNSYGHPNQGVLERLKNMGALMHRTDEEGDIRYSCFAERCLYAR